MGQHWNGAWMSATPECIESIVLAYIRLWGLLSANQREVLRRFEVEGIVSVGFVVRALIVVRHHPLRANQRDSPFFELQ